MLQTCSDAWWRKNLGTNNESNDEKGKHCGHPGSQGTEGPHISGFIILRNSKVQFLTDLIVMSESKIWILYYFVDLTWQLNSLVVRVIMFRLKGFHCQRCAPILHQLFWTKFDRSDNAEQQNVFTRSKTFKPNSTSRKAHNSSNFGISIIVNEYPTLPCLSRAAKKPIRQISGY